MDDGNELGRESDAVPPEAQRIDVEPSQFAQRSGRQRVTARLVARDGPLLQDGDVVTGAGQPVADRRPGGASADDEDVGVQRVIRSAGRRRRTGNRFGADRVDALEADGALNQGQANSLRRKLESAIRQLDRGHANAAVGILGGVINQLEDFVDDGVLTADEAALLLPVVTALRDQIA